MSQTFVIIGASTGLGHATARELARDHRVIVAGRDVAKLRAEHPRAAAVLAVDLASLEDAKRFGRELADHGPIHGLALNAGGQDAGAPTRTRDGFETTFAVNHLAHFAVVMSALPALAPAARVIWVGSGTLEPEGAKRFGFRGGRYTSARALAAGDGDPAVDEAQRAKDRYATSKLCDVMAMAAIARRTDRIAALAIDPGLMPGTGLARQHSALARLLWHTVLHVIARFVPGTSSASRSGRTYAWMLTSPALAGTTGRYLDYRRRELSWTGSDRVDRQDELYATSLELCGFARDPLAATASRSPAAIK
jgi:NAD(P)-dependent dehydrogenase (short-subunit alcohol dehydrogenase family)